jgi:2-methylcitrate dehydratase PrpD
MTLTESLADYWSSVHYADLPPETVRLAKRFLIDTLAAGVAGAGTEVASIVLDALGVSSSIPTHTNVEPAEARAPGFVHGEPLQAQTTPRAGSIVWGRSELLPAREAALVNGTASHALELDDFGGCGHSGAVVIPALCAVAAGKSGKETLTAIVAGYDVAARVLEGAGGYRPHNDLGWHSCGTAGSFGAAAAVAKILGFDREHYADALGIAGSFTGGIWAFLADGAMTKRFHPGKAAENGLTAALLARSGMSGPREVLEAQWGGFFSTYSRGIATPEAALKDLGVQFRIARSGMKPYACCRGLHATLDALFDIVKETGAKTGDIERMVVHGNEQNKLQFDRPEIRTMLDAQFSFQYALAVAAESGRATLDQFTPLRTRDPQVQTLMRTVEVAAYREQPPGTYPPLEIRFRNGRAIERHIAFAKGAPENPLSDAELHAKVVSQVEPVLGAAGCKSLMATVASLEDVPNARELLTLLARPSH